MSFLRHGEIFPSDGGADPRVKRPRLIVWRSLRLAIPCRVGLHHCPEGVKKSLCIRKPGEWFRSLSDLECSASVRRLRQLNSWIFCGITAVTKHRGTTSALPCPQINGLVAVSAAMGRETASRYVLIDGMHFLVVIFWGFRVFGPAILELRSVC